ncbi:hypothetical protein BCR42DRAFT_420534 [Absidia repens]|uniref:Fungal lipase-type domain-containing protein n=1 Tax=Absidia repens TaxID=90262 RepID=A0A1X2I9V0_9FUNG|nr:hypothetical protein BCR42DRAFT_420534 [Absidia repens]
MVATQQQQQPHPFSHLILTMVVAPLSKGSNYLSSRGYKAIQRAVPRCTQILFHLDNVMLNPLTTWLAHHIPVVSILLALVFQSFFFLSFLLLLLCEEVIRVSLMVFIGQHPSGRSISVVNAMDPMFDFHALEKKSTTTTNVASPESSPLPTAPSLLTRMMNRPQYSLPLAYTLSVASKLGYEDIDVIKYELKQAGSNPLNIQNCFTNLDVRMRKVYAPWGYMGRVHQGYFDALGDPVLPTMAAQCEAQSKRRFVWWGEPVDTRLTHVSATEDENNSNNNDDDDINMYRQLEAYLLPILQQQQQQQEKTLGTMFLAKMVQSTSPLLSHLGGLYTFGQPKVGDAQFSKIFDAKLSSKIFHHVYNNDIFARLPSYSEYATPSGTLVFIDSAYNMTIYPPDPYEGTPMAIRPISYLHLSGLLDRHVVERLPSESWLRLLFRIMAPYMINDHFASNYPHCLKKGDMTWVVLGQATDNK